MPTIEKHGNGWLFSIAIQRSGSTASSFQTMIISNCFLAASAIMRWKSGECAKVRVKEKTPKK